MKPWTAAGSAYKLSLLLPVCGLVEPSVLYVPNDSISLRGAIFWIHWNYQHAWLNRFGSSDPVGLYWRARLPDAREIHWHPGLATLYVELDHETYWQLQASNQQDIGGAYIFYVTCGCEPMTE